MSFGIDNAISEITLVLFTTLAPSGAIACAIVCCVLLLPSVQGELRDRLNQFLWIPILVALVGLVASATHLGNPSNALYVLTGVGRSPLSNEVLSAIVAFGLAGSYWLVSFSRKRRPLLERIWLVAIVAGALAFAFAIAFAYNVETIATWSLPTVPASLLLNAFIGGPLVALTVFAAAEHATKEADGLPSSFSVRTGRLLVALSAVALVANVACYVVQGMLMQHLANAIVSATSLVPHYHLCVIAFAILCAGGIAIAFWTIARRKRVLAGTIAASAIAYCGIFIMRFVFYAMHMTV